MAIPFTCPHCGTFSQVANEYAGRTGPCATCGKPITIPGMAAAATGAIYDAPRAGAATAAPRSKGTMLLLIVLAAGLLLMLVTCSGIGLALLLPAVNAGREAARRAQCSNNLKEIALAIESYRSDFGAYPPAYIPAADGSPMHSWRALVLRYLDEPLAQEYDFNEPWNSPKNQALALRMPAVFACPSNPDSRQQFTSYVAIVEPGHMFQGSQGTLPNQIVAPSTSIALIEVAGQVQIPWLEPRDFTLADLAPTVGDQSRPSISSFHVSAAHLMNADLFVEFVPNGTPTAGAGQLASPP